MGKLEEYTEQYMEDATIENDIRDCARLLIGNPGEQA
jgi:hypothetical protein